MQPMGERMKRLGLDKLAIDERLALLDALEAGGDRGRLAAEVLVELRR